jgi:tetratricopeptide (TPR) repeat protein
VRTRRTSGSDGGRVALVGQPPRTCTRWARRVVRLGRTIVSTPSRHEAAPLIHSNLARAEALLREALTADLYFGPAHNNLGVIYLAQGRLYEAAAEFEWARKLMPGHPDPRLNLALTLERAGRIDQAIDAYRAALDVHPDHVPTIQAMARIQVRSGRIEDRTARLLDDIALRGESEEWRTWARAQRFRLPP